METTTAMNTVVTVLHTESTKLVWVDTGITYVPANSHHRKERNDES